jgi:hypothetical protein
LCATRHTILNFIPIRALQSDIWGGNYNFESFCWFVWMSTSKKQMKKQEAEKNGGKRNNELIK